MELICLHIFAIYELPSRKQTASYIHKSDDDDDNDGGEGDDGGGGDDDDDDDDYHYQIYILLTLTRTKVRLFYRCPDHRGSP